MLINYLFSSHSLKTLGINHTRPIQLLTTAFSSQLEIFSMIPMVGVTEPSHWGEECVMVTINLQFWPNTLSIVSPISWVPGDSWTLWLIGHHKIGWQQYGLNITLGTLLHLHPPSVFHQIFTITKPVWKLFSFSTLYEKVYSYQQSFLLLAHTPVNCRSRVKS